MSAIFGGFPEFQSLQDFDTSRDVAARYLEVACRIGPRDDAGKLTIAPDSLGHVKSGFLVQARRGQRGNVHAWVHAAPAVITRAAKKSKKKGSRTKKDKRAAGRAAVSLIRQEDGGADPRFEELPVHLPPRLASLPVGTTGVLLRGSEDDRQALVFVPASSGELVAVHAAGDAANSSVVFDTNDEGEIDPERSAPFHSALRVLIPTEGHIVGGGEAGGVLSLVGGGAGQDGISGHHLVCASGTVDPEGQELALAGGGDELNIPPPLSEGGSDHVVGQVTIVKDVEDLLESFRENVANHLAQNADDDDDGDAPLKSQTKPKKEVESQVGTKDPDDGDGVERPDDEPDWGEAPGDLVAATMTSVLGGPLDVGSVDDVHRCGTHKDGTFNLGHLSAKALIRLNRDKDGPWDFELHAYREPEPQPYEAQTHIRFDPSLPHEAGVLGEGPGRWRILSEASFTKEVIIIEPPEPDPEPPPPGQHGPERDPDDDDGGSGVPEGYVENPDGTLTWRPKPKPPIEPKGGGLEEDKAPKIGHDPTGLGYVAAHNCISLPGIVGRALPHALGEVNYGEAGKLTARQKKALAAAPLVGGLVFWSGGDGTAHGVEYFHAPGEVPHGAPTAQGGCILLPPGVGVGELVREEVTRATPQALLVLPTNKSEDGQSSGSAIAWGTPTEGGRVKDGVIAYHTAVGLGFYLVDGQGKEHLALQLGEGKATIPGRLDPTTLELTDQAWDAIPPEGYGFRLDTRTSNRPLWREGRKPGDGQSHRVAYLEDTLAGLRGLGLRSGVFEVGLEETYVEVDLRPGDAVVTLPLARDYGTRVLVVKVVWPGEGRLRLRTSGSDVFDDEAREEKLKAGALWLKASPTGRWDRVASFGL